MIRIRLPQTEAQELEAAFRSTEDPKLRDPRQAGRVDWYGFGRGSG